jgi:hypothetical protein
MPGDVLAILNDKARIGPGRSRVCSFPSSVRWPDGQRCPRRWQDNRPTDVRNTDAQELKAFEKMAIDGRATRIDAAVILLITAAATTVYVWWDRLPKLRLPGKPATSSMGCPRSS